MVKKVILAVLGLSFALFVSSCEDKTAKLAKKKVCEMRQEQPFPVEKERHHSKW
jgi:hypothetical protein